ncbi:MAG: aminoacyl-tRNA hydrolase [Planctomycetaceae bacterium]|nr:aminoacyl-tRNA hydrolase [Planctomycetaceae bacterium]
MKLVVGLGNPGLEYQRTRHNVGFDCIDRLARRVADPSQTAKARFQALSLEGEVGGEKVLLLKPMTYMNLSGTTVAEALRFYKLDATRDLLVIVDDIALPCGAIRLRSDGSAGGHNGLADIEAKLGSNRYARCRIGIDAPGQIPQRDYVLGKFRPDQQPLVEEALGLASDAAECWAKSGITEAMNRFNRRTERTPAANPKPAQGADQRPKTGETN